MSWQAGYTGVSSSMSTSERQGVARGRLAAYEYPRRSHILDDVPETATGKIKRGALRSGEASTDASVSP